MSAVLVTVPNAVAAVLNGVDFGAFVTDLGITDDWTAKRSYGQFKDVLEQAGPLLVDVVPVTHPATKMATRGSIVYLTTLDVGVRKKFGPSQTDQDNGGICKVAEVDRLVEFVQRVFSFFVKEANWNLPDDDGSSWVSGTIRMPYSRKHLEDYRQFTGIVRLQYQTERTL